jgi:hypothetical protein
MNRNLPLLCLLIGLCSCARSSLQQISYQQQFMQAPQRPDYSFSAHWAALPWKTDPSDSVPLPIRASYVQDTTVDVFFIHPTTYTQKDKPFGWNAPINDTALANKTDQSTILYQASTFNAAGRVFAPRYRQAHLGAYYPLTASDTAKALAAFDTAYADIKAAFQYYLRYYNHGKPIIIAAHSQGSTHGKRLLKEFFDGQPLTQQLIAAYLIGMPVEQDQYTHLKACDLPNQTGCIISWRTFKQGYVPEYVSRETEKIIVTNPLTWHKDQPNAGFDKNEGGILLKFNKLVKQVAEANLNKNVIWTRKPRFFGNLFYTTRNYHIGDINLYYLSIRKNLEERKSSFKKNSPHKAGE